MNEKKAKRLRRELMTHDQWLQAKRDVTYVHAKDRRDRELPCAVRSPGLINSYQENKRGVRGH